MESADKDSHNMSSDFVLNIMNLMKKHKLMLSYRGAFSESITESLLSTTEKKLDIDGAERTLKKKVFNIMVECLQNICKHGEKKSEELPSLFMIGKTKDAYLTFSGNVVCNSKVEGLKEKLELLNKMSVDELKELYKSVVDNGEFSEVGGAGLGLIDMARKSGNPLEYNFRAVDDNHTFFALRTQIANAKKE